MTYYFKVLKNYAAFNGRADRREYWYFVLSNVIANIILNIIERALKISLLSHIYNLAVLLPSIAVAIRRMHDVGKSGWYGLIPIYNLILACTPGAPGTNNYGLDPKAAAEQPAATPQQALAKEKSPTKDIEAIFRQATQEYQNGNNQEAFLLYSECAELGEATSQFNLAVFYREGIGCEKNMERAMQWYRKAAENGHPDAAGMMGRFYANGECGLTKNMAKAHAYFAWATAIFETDGNQKANETRNWRDKFGRMLTPGQLQESTSLGKDLSEANLRRSFSRTGDKSR